MTEKKQSLPLRMFNRLGTGVRRVLWSVIIMVLIIGAVGSLILYQEMKSSPIQSMLFDSLSEDITWSIKEGPAPRPAVVKHGPFNKRRGYTKVPEVIKRLEDRGFHIDKQAQPSERFIELMENDYIPPFDQTSRATFEILDRRGAQMYRTSYPIHAYTTYNDIPDLVKFTLFFIEDRSHLKAQHLKRSPVVEWDRLALAGGEYMLDKIGLERNVPGASTLVTQYFKFTHDPDGQTADMMAKWRQMYSASLYIYQMDKNKKEQTQKIVTQYINSIPMSAQRNWGSVHGLGDSIYAYYGQDFNDINDALKNPKDDVKTAWALRIVASIFVSQRSPSRLLRNAKLLDPKVNYYLKQMHMEGYISKKLLALALERSSTTLKRAPHSIPLSRQAKVSDSVRYEVGKMLGLNNLSALDQWDVRAQSTLDMTAQKEIQEVLSQKMYDPEFLKKEGFMGTRLIEKSDPKGIIYSFTLHEKLKGRNVMRVQVDTSDKRLNINESSRLDLGSTAKLRTLITYLQIMSDLYTKISPMSRQEMLDIKLNQGDSLTHWARGHLFMKRSKTRLDFLKDAMDRKYSASPYYAFLTSGGMHRFHNFSDDYDSRRMDLWSATRTSVNLVFVRLMQDVAHYYRFDTVDDTILSNEEHPKRTEYLRRWARKDVAKHFNRAWAKWGSIEQEDIIERFGKEFAKKSQRLATIVKMLKPETTAEQLNTLMEQYTEKPEKFDAELFIKNESSWSLADRAYVTQMHPIELRILKQRWGRETLTKKQGLKSAQDNVDDYYVWLLKKISQGKQNKFIRIELETDAFQVIHKQWAAMGYPFDRLTPSLATALGASGDRPSSLANMMGILVNDGLSLPNQRLKAFRLAESTPYEVHMSQTKFAPAIKVLDPEVAQVARMATEIVVKRGTAKRASKMFDDGVVIGGKTGTGDHRDEKLDRWGRVISSKGIRRSGTFTFFYDDRFFGVMTVYVDENVDDYKFTSALAVKTFKTIGPTLKKLMTRNGFCKDSNLCFNSNLNEQEKAESLEALTTASQRLLKKADNILPGNSAYKSLKPLVKAVMTKASHKTKKQTQDPTSTSDPDINIKKPIMGAKKVIRVIKNSLKE